MHKENNDANDECYMWLSQSFLIRDMQNFDIIVYDTPILYYSRAFIVQLHSPDGLTFENEITF